MNKPIIIDGVDVSECEWLSYAYKYIGKDDKIYYCGQDIKEDMKCKKRNCLLKQLKTSLKRLKAENEELKEENAILKLITEPQKEEIQKYRDKALQLKQALEEVREIAYITDFDIRDIQKIVNEVLKDE